MVNQIMVLSLIKWIYSGQNTGQLVFLELFPNQDQNRHKIQDPHLVKTMAQFKPWSWLNEDKKPDKIFI